MNIAIVGATGLVGEAIVSLLAEKNVPVRELFLLASESGAGSSVAFADRNYKVQSLEKFDFSQAEVAVFAAGASVSQQYIPDAVDAGCKVVDLSPAYRYEEGVPLLVAGVNDELLSLIHEQNIVACADASVVQLAQTVKPLLELGPLQSISVTQFQPASARGREGVEQLARQSARLLNGLSVNESGEAQIAFNVLPVSGQVQESGYSSDELKLMLEMQRVFAGQIESMHATAIRVPVFHGCVQSVSVRSHQALDAAQAEGLWQAVEADSALEWIGENDPQALSPVELADKTPELIVGRVRNDFSLSGAICYTSIADNVRYGAALNAVRIVEKLRKDYL